MNLDPNHVITTQEQVREHYQPAMQRALDKELGVLDPHCRNFISRSPFLCIATSSQDGFADCSPKGDAPGFVGVLDDATLAIPDRKGNNRLDTITNLISNPRVGLIFFIPGVDETLRVNGTAQITVDPGLMEPFAVRGKVPTSVIVVHVREAYIHCPKALVRSKLWAQAAGFDRASFPTLVRMLSDQTGQPLAGEALEAAEKLFAEHLEDSLY